MENMTELERKFIMMSRIAVALHCKGLVTSVNLHCDFASILVHDPSDNYTIIEHLCDDKITEQELLAWWSAIEG